MKRLALPFFCLLICGASEAVGQSPQPASAPGSTSATTTPAPAPVPGTNESTELDRIERRADELKLVPTTSNTHRLGEGDVIEIKVYQEDELTTRSRLDSDGLVAMPLLGLIKVGGQTVGQAQTFIRDLLAEDYLQHPRVSLTVLEFAKKRFSVVGEVRQPGFYMFPEGEKMTLLQAVAMAGGLTPFARSGKVTIKRFVDGKETVLQADLKEMAKKAKTTVLEVKPGDAILVHQSIF